ncbi:MAG: hypothetical protein NTU43_00595 [Bacteroidetes bacterium]|nr:hypothetical protein [Bacteroidota bacterium]
MRNNIQALVIVTTLNNIGTVYLNLYQENSTTGNPITIQAGENYSIAKGFSIVTISNLSNISETKISCKRGV